MISLTRNQRILADIHRGARRREIVKDVIACAWFSALLFAALWLLGGVL